MESTSYYRGDLFTYLCKFILQQFLQDLYSGKLHREFHYGPDSEQEDTSSESAPERIKVINSSQTVNNHSTNVVINYPKMPLNFFIVDLLNNFQIDPQTGEQLPSKDINATPPPSQFANLGPSRNRYTLLHDEF